MRIVAALLCLLSFSLFAQAPEESVSAPILPPIPAEAPLFSDTGDAAVARRYLEWAERELAAGKKAEAIAALERGADYSAASSDLSLLLSRLRLEAGRSRFAALEACRTALETRRWERYTPEDARLLEAKILTELTFFEEAIKVLDFCDAERYETQYRLILALRGLVQAFQRDEAELIAAFARVMDRFPRETAPVRVLFDYASRNEPGENPRSPLRQLVELSLRRLPVLIQLDPELAYMASPFIYDKEIARNYVASYRAMENPRPDSLPEALRLGLVSGTRAVEELFAWRDTRDAPETDKPRAALTDGGAVLNKELIAAIDALLGNGADHYLLGRNLLRFSGVIVEDGNYDGINEVWVRYHEGMIRSYRYDSYQDGEADLLITFGQGIPARAEITLPPPYAAEPRRPEYSGAAGASLPQAAAAPAMSTLAIAAPPGKKALVYWERYPAVLYTELDGKRYIPRPLDFFYTPFRFAPLVPDGPDYPEREAVPAGVITERSLLSFSVIMEKPSADFPGAVERVELSEGIPIKAAVFVDDKKVSETEFRLGKPLVQHLDIDEDGRMETIRRYDPETAYRVISAESDLDGDGSYEYRETLREDGSFGKSWDFDRDGIRETEQ